MIKTEEEIQALKDSWVKDPCWDIEETEGFEEHKDELLAWRNEREAGIEKVMRERLEQRAKKIKEQLGISDPMAVLYLHTFDEIEVDLCSLNSQIGDGGSALGYCQFVLAQSQVRATLLLAAQVKRVADLLAENAGENQLDFMTRLYKVD